MRHRWSASCWRFLQTGPFPAIQWVSKDGTRVEGSIEGRLQQKTFLSEK
jgi:hypothetical protein